MLLDCLIRYGQKYAPSAYDKVYNINKMSNKVGAILQNQTINSLQLKLTELLTSPISCSKFTSQCVFIQCRDKTYSQIFFVDQNYSTIHNVLSFQGVQSIKHISVNNQWQQGKVTVVYYANGQICVYYANLSADQTARRSSLDLGNIAKIKFNHELKEISNIIITQNKSIICSLVTTTSQVYILSYRSSDHSLNIYPNLPTVTQKITKIFKSIFVPQPIALPVLLHSYGHTCFIDGFIWSLVLADKQIKVKSYKIDHGESVGIRQREGRDWTIDLHDIVKGQIVNVIFVDGFIGQYSIRLFIASSYRSQIFLTSLSLNLNLKSMNYQIVPNIFGVDSNYDDSQKSQYVYSKRNDLIQLNYFNDCIYCLYSKHYGKTIGRGQNIFTVVMANNIEDFVVRASKFGIRGEARLVAIRAQRQRQKGLGANGRILFVGEDNVYELFRENYDEDNSESIRKSIDQLQQRLRVLPADSERKYDMDINQSATETNRDFQNPFSNMKLNRYINHRDYGKLFKLLTFERENYAKKIRDGMDLSNVQEIKNQAIVEIISQLFSKNNESLGEFDIQLIKYILTDEVYKRLQENNEELQNFTRELIVHQNLEKTKQLLRVFLDTRNYTAIYNVCIITIPTFLQNFNADFNTSQIQEESYLSQSVDEIKVFIRENFISIYEELIISLLENYLEIEPVLVGNTERSIIKFGEYEQKQLLDKYLSVRNLTALADDDARKRAYENNSGLISIIEKYYKKQEKMRHFLAGMAIKHKNILIFDYLLQRRAIVKREIDEFVVSYQDIKGSEEQLGLLFENLVHFELFYLGISSQKPNRRNSFNQNRLNDGLEVLKWIPQKYSQRVYYYLLDNEPRIGILYGMTIKTRRSIAKDLCSRIYLFDKITRSSQVLQIFEPFYTATDSMWIKLNIDLAKFYLNTGNKQPQFASYFKLVHHYNEAKKTNRLFQLSVGKDQRKQLNERINKYANQEVKKMVNQVFATQSEISQKIADHKI